jgi:hypothetical protein
MRFSEGSIFATPTQLFDNKAIFATLGVAIFLICLSEHRYRNRNQPGGRKYLYLARNNYYFCVDGYFADRQVDKMEKITVYCTMKKEILYRILLLHLSVNQREKLKKRIM